MKILFVVLTNFHYSMLEVLIVPLYDASISFIRIIAKNQIPYLLVTMGLNYSHMNIWCAQRTRFLSIEGPLIIKYFLCLGEDRLWRDLQIAGRSQLWTVLTGLARDGLKVSDEEPLTTPCQVSVTFISCKLKSVTGHGSRSGEEIIENKADYPRAGSNVSSCRYQLLAIDLPDRMIWQKDCFLLSTRSPHYRMAFDRIQF